MLEQNGFDPNAPVIRPISIEPLDLMMVLMKVAIYAGLILSSPIVLFEIWSFVSPGLRDREKRAIRPVLFGGLFFFIGGWVILASRLQNP